MTNSTAIVLGLALLCLVVADLLFFEMDHVVFLGKRLLDLIDWVSFWR